MQGQQWSNAPPSMNYEENLIIDLKVGSAKTVSADSVPNGVLYDRNRRPLRKAL